MSRSRKSRHPFAVLALAAAAASALPALAASPDGWTFAFDARYRYEHVDQDNALRSASAQTLRTRLGVATPEWHGLSALAEVDNVSRIGGARYNDTRNGRTGYSTVPDPQGTGVNQLVVKQAFAGGSVRVGRQRINLDNQRFVGGVGWRQNEQTYDGGLVELKPTASSVFTYAYVDNVDTVFGPDAPAAPNRTAPADIRGHSHLLNLRHDFGKQLKATVYHYRLGLDSLAVAADAPLGTLSSKTSGLRLQGQLAGVAYTLEHAWQSSLAGNPWALDSRYRLVELGRGWGGVQWKLGQEVLGAGRGAGAGNRAFQTPLATKHVFQGWADMFLATPADGLRDAYLGATAPLAGGQLQAAYHDFRSDRGGHRFGGEWDVAYSHALPMAKGWTAMVKYAAYDSADRARTVDTDKAWVQLQYTH